MSDELDPKNGLTTVGDRFPFVMVLTTTFLLGAMFIILNGHLLILTVEGRHFGGLREILAGGVVPFWKQIFQSGGLFTSFLFLVLSLVIGLLLTPIDRGITFFFANVWKAIPRKRKSARLPPFTSMQFTNPRSAAFLAWLMTKREAKLHWEWELFHFYIYWGVFTNIAIFVFLASFLQWPNWSVFEALLYSASLVLFFAFAAARSEVMARVHKHYWELYDAQPPAAAARR